MQRSKRVIAIAVVASLLGGSVAWVVALWMAPLGAYEVSLHLDDGRFAVVLDRRPSSDRAPEGRDPAMNDGDGLHDEYVVTVATLDACSTREAGPSGDACAPPAAVAVPVDVAPVLRMACIVGARVGPPVPTSFSILRI